MDNNKENVETVDASEGMVVMRRLKKADISCTEGVLWITYDGSGDIILFGGQMRRITSKSATCITALASSRFTITRGTAKKTKWSPVKFICELPLLHQRTKMA